MDAEKLKVLDPVALTSDIPEISLRRGQMGTVVEELAGSVYEVEFSDEDGVPFAIVPLRAEQLIALRIAKPKAS